MDDAKILADLVEGITSLSRAFKTNHLNPPLKISVDHDTYSRLRLLRQSTMVYDPKQGMQVKICGVLIEPAKA